MDLRKKYVAIPAYANAQRRPSGYTQKILSRKAPLNGHLKHCNPLRKKKCMNARKKSFAFLWKKAQIKTKMWSMCRDILFDKNYNKTCVINNPLVQTHSLTSSDHYFYATFVLIYDILKGGDGLMEVRTEICAKVMITTVGRPSGSI